MRPRNFEEFQDFLRKEAVFERFGIRRIGVFGSLARGESDYNDIDLLIEENLDFDTYFALKDFLETHLDAKIDLVQRRHAEPVILYYALKDMRYAAA
ncbi:MAG: nucleotidyltransferase domain-containing protein [Saprospiraceae bacterium]|nr:nucleotidyltransferase domain-containing protein [Saprospiraceae bacterium]MDX1942494.1 nucleotidyltransferase domain-containing protein [Saprospiraceae bacterium]